MTDKHHQSKTTLSKQIQGLSGKIRPFSRQQSDAIAAGWGFAEATFFFIVPDMFITWRALTSWKAAWRACWLTLVGALIGGNVLYLASWLQPLATYRFVDRVPGVTPAIMQQAKQDIRQQGSLAILYGPAKSVPYKVYATLAPNYHVNYWKFILISVPARLLRFMAVAAITAGLSYGLRNILARRYHYLVWALVWAGIYAWYFAGHWF